MKSTTHLRVLAVAAVSAALVVGCGHVEPEPQRTTERAATPEVNFTSDAFGFDHRCTGPTLHNLEGLCIEEDEHCTVEYHVTNDAIQFAQDSAQISARGRTTLETIAADVMERYGHLDSDATVRIEVEGNTSTEGDADHNQRLSERRAAAARREMENLLAGRPSDGPRLQFHDLGRGENNPVVYPDDTEAKRQRNRRVVITVHPPASLTGDCEAP